MRITAAIFMMNLNMTFLPMLCTTVSSSIVEDEEDEETGNPDYLMRCEEIKYWAEVVIENPKN